MAGLDEEQACQSQCQADERVDRPNYGIELVRYELCMAI